MTEAKVCDEGVPLRAGERAPEAEHVIQQAVIGLGSQARGTDMRPILREVWRAVVQEERERAARIAEARADSLAAWTRQLPLHSPERTDKSVRAGECYEVAAAIRGGQRG
jgi:hypothetical protein